MPKTRAQLDADIDSTFTDTPPGGITPSEARAVFKDMVTASPNIADDQPATIAAGGTGGGTAIAALDNLITAEATVASATTTNLGAATTRNVSISGTTTITGFGTVAAGVMRYGRFAGILTLTHNATSLILPNAGSNITTAANDRFSAVSLGSGNWLVYSYQRANGTALSGAPLASPHFTGDPQFDISSFYVKQTGFGDILFLDETGAAFSVPLAETVREITDGDASTVLISDLIVIYNRTDSADLVFAPPGNGNNGQHLTLTNSAAATVILSGNFFNGSLGEVSTISLAAKETIAFRVLNNPTNTGANWRVVFRYLANATPGSGTVTTVSVATANGVSGSVANPTTTPAISISLGAITPTSVNTGPITATGIVSQSAASVKPPNALGAFVIDVTKAWNTKTIAANQTFTFSGTPATANTFFSLLVTNSDSVAHTLTIPSSFSSVQVTNITSILIPASGKLMLTWQYDGTVYNIFGDPALTTGTGPQVLGTSPSLVTPNLGTAASGNLAACTADGTNLVGYRGAPQTSYSANYTTVLTDAGHSLFHPVGDNNARTLTIDSNANVAYPIGTILAGINMAAASVTIAITSDTMTLLPAGTTGSRTLAQHGRFSMEKITSTGWVISGNSALT